MNSTTVRLLLCILIIHIIVNVVNATDNTTESETSGSGEVMRIWPRKQDRSTSSESKVAVVEDSESDGLSMNLHESGDSTSSSEKEKYKPKPSIERKGWRVWHRKCKQCPEDMKKKWRDPSIRWICGGYQRARRTFKSKCMMEYRNCQDGTMFVKIHGNRCKNSTEHGDHFFYEYRVAMSDDTSDSKSSSTDSSDSSESE